MAEPANVIVDLSHWNENVDFKVAKEDGIHGVIYKATQGLTYVDSTYATSRTRAEEQGLLWGAYHFGTGENGKEQAMSFLKTVGDYSEVLLILDIEENPGGKTITPEQADDFVKHIIEVTKRYPVVYGNANFLKDFATTLLTKCPLWVARYGPTPLIPQGWKTWNMWQYTDGKNGPEPRTVKGIGPCDRDKFNGTIQELRDFWK